MACSLYIDDRLNGELFSSEGFWSRPISRRTPDYSYRSAMVALYIVCKVVVGLGYFLGLAKCVLVPATRIHYLGMIVDSAAQAFCIPEDKKLKFAQLREQILLREATVSSKSLQRLMGKCISFSLAFPGAKFYIREMAASIARASNGSEVKISPVLREEILFWRFLDGWDKVVRWRSESHVPRMHPPSDGQRSFIFPPESFRLVITGMRHPGRAHKREGNVGHPQRSTVTP